MFDYIVIGAGSAGCVVANRLSAAPKNKVLVLEAGPRDNNPMIHMPGGCQEVLKSKTLNWHFYSTPQKKLNDRKYFVPRGRTLGGSSSANGMVYIRGQAQDYDQWAAMGNQGWSYAEVLPHFKHLEDQVRGPDEFHGIDGELFVNNSPSDNPLFNRFMAAGNECGYPTNHDFNGATQEGIGRFQVTIKNGKRWSAARAFLTPILDRPNLTVLTDAHVNRLILEGKRVVGVEFVKAGKVEKVMATKEVILSAGAIQSPQILQLSGIGHEADLKAAGISLNVNLPGVGRNLMEHLDVVLPYEVTSPITLNGNLKPHKQLQIAFQYFAMGKGIGTYSNMEGGAFLKTDPSLDRPDMQIHFVPAYMTSLLDKLPKEEGCTIHGCLLRPKSRGTVKALSGDPRQAPEIDFNFLAHEEDAKMLIRTFRMLREIMAAKAWGGLIGREYRPGLQVETDEQILACLGEITETVYHPAGTCKMGNDDMAVVDHELRVHGVEGLRVADVSICPEMISGNTNAPAMMIGSKCASMILGTQIN